MIEQLAPGIVRTVTWPIEPRVTGESTSANASWPAGVPMGTIVAAGVRGAAVDTDVGAALGAVVGATLVTSVCAATRVGFARAPELLAGAGVADPQASTVRHQAQAVVTASLRTLFTD
ncbi:MAG: hypothetical protein ACRDF9_00545 [Candidatus Limnocylindria bacterium]